MYLRSHLNGNPEWETGLDSNIRLWDSANLTLHRGDVNQVKVETLTSFVRLDFKNVWVSFLLTF